ncbi:ISAzo13-like element transposase-related protein [Holospora obtusa]|uniref:ISAzo13-like element transposase-related protein n=1 Tax=Holospora obtusa TaxID=49893 RepID=UPI00094AC016|nr:hypothetical protein [Holospora obtusa]
MSKNWRGKPLISRKEGVNLIGNTTTNKGLKISAVLDQNNYNTGRKIDDNVLAALNIFADQFHLEWNDIIKPKIL